MPIDTKSVAAKNNGYILRTDGHPDMPVHTELQRVNNYATPAGNTTSYDMTTGAPGPVAINGMTDVFPNCSEANLTDILPIGNSPLTGKLEIPIDAQYNPTNMNHTIVTYPVTALL
jgi:hypothetical protein